MKLWLLKPKLDREPNPWQPWYDKCFGSVVRAETEEDARRDADLGAGGENHTGYPEYREQHPWLSDEYSTCEELTPDGEAGVILSDFRSA